MVNFIGGDMHANLEYEDTHVGIMVPKDTDLNLFKEDERYQVNVSVYSLSPNRELVLMDNEGFSATYTICEAIQWVMNLSSYYSDIRVSRMFLIKVVETSVKYCIYVSNQGIVVRNAVNEEELFNAIV